MPGCNNESENSLVSRARRYLPLEEFLRQRKDENNSFAATYAQLANILGVAWS